MGDHDALLMEGPSGQVLQAFLSDELVLHVAEPWVLSRDDMLRFAAGVRLTPYASTTWTPGT